MIGTFTLNGIEVPITDVNYTPHEPVYGVDLGFIRRDSAPISFETTVPFVGGFEGFAKLLRCDPPGASSTTLARRVKYGGRKGRSAMRRLFARAVPVELANAHMRMRGRCVMLDERELRISMSQRSGRGRR